MYITDLVKNHKITLPNRVVFGKRCSVDSDSETEVGHDVWYIPDRYRFDRGFGPLLKKKPPGTGNRVRANVIVGFIPSAQVEIKKANKAR